jgi:uroporphyrinogen-III synthase
VACCALQNLTPSRLVSPEKSLERRLLEANVMQVIRRVDRGSSRRGRGRLLRRRIAIPNHQSLDPLAAVLVEQGATAVRCPLTDRGEPDPSPIETGLAALVVGGFDYLILRTRQGIVGILDAAERAGLKADVLLALARVTKVAGGPEAASGLHEVDLSPDLRAAASTTSALLRAMQTIPLARRLVALEVPAEDPGADLVASLQRAGAGVYPLTPHPHHPATNDDDVERFIEAICAERIDATVFTAATQLERLFQVARERRLATQLRKGLAQVHVSGVGPIVLASLRRRRLRVDSVAARPFFAQQIAEALADCLGPAPG